MKTLTHLIIIPTKLQYFVNNFNSLKLIILQYIIWEYCYHHLRWPYVKGLGQDLDKLTGDDTPLSKSKMS